MSEQQYCIKWDHDPAKGEKPWVSNIRPLSFAQAEHLMDRAEIEGGFSGEIVSWTQYLAETSSVAEEGEAQDPQCPRCKDYFGSEKELETHVFFCDGNIDFVESV